MWKYIVERYTEADDTHPEEHALDGNIEFFTAPEMSRERKYRMAIEMLHEKYSILVSKYYDSMTDENVYINFTCPLCVVNGYRNLTHGGTEYLCWKNRCPWTVLEGLQCFNDESINTSMDFDSVYDSENNLARLERWMQEYCEDLKQQYPEMFR